jgi:hypothetical protein
VADFDPPSDLFHIGPVLNDVRSDIATLLSDRGILITNQDAQQTQLSEILAAQAGQESAISSTGAQLSANIAALGVAINARLDSLDAKLDAISASFSSKLDAFNVQNAQLTLLLEAMIQAFQGVATLDAQNQMAVLLTELVQATSPEKPASLRLDTTSPVTTPQPIPAELGS